MSRPVVLYDECICCVVSAEPQTPAETVMGMLIMWLVEGASLDVLVGDLCGPHRRALDGATLDALKTLTDRVEPAADYAGRGKSCPCGWLVPQSFIVSVRADTAVLPGMITRMRCPACGQWVRSAAAPDRGGGRHLALVRPATPREEKT